MTKQKQIEEMAKVIGDADQKCYEIDDCDECPFHHIELGLCKERFVADALYNAGYRKQEWISVEERLPGKKDDYLVFTKNKDIKVMPFFLERNASAAIYGRGFCEWVRGRRTNDDDWWKPVCYVTHWMPLPMPPKGGDGR